MNLDFEITENSLEVIQSTLEKMTAGLQHCFESNDRFEDLDYEIESELDEDELGYESAPTWVITGFSEVKTIFMAAATYPELHPLLETHVKYGISLLESGSYAKEDCKMPGLIAAQVLAFEDAKYLPLYTRLLREDRLRGGEGANLYDTLEELGKKYTHEQNMFVDELWDLIAAGIFINIADTFPFLDELEDEGKLSPFFQKNPEELQRFAQRIVRNYQIFEPNDEDISFQTKAPMLDAFQNEEVAEKLKAAALEYFGTTEKPADMFIETFAASSAEPQNRTLEISTGEYQNSMNCGIEVKSGKHSILLPHSTELILFPESEEDTLHILNYTTGDLRSEQLTDNSERIISACISGNNERFAAIVGKNPRTREVIVYEIANPDADTFDPSSENLKEIHRAQGNFTKVASNFAGTNFALCGGKSDAGFRYDAYLTIPEEIDNPEEITMINSDTYLSDEGSMLPVENDEIEGTYWAWRGTLFNGADATRITSLPRGYSTAIDPTGHFRAATDERTITICDALTGDSLISNSYFWDDSYWSPKVAYSNDSKTIFAFHCKEGNTRVELYHHRELKKVFETSYPGREVHDALFDRINNSIVIVCYGGQVDVLNAAKILSEVENEVEELNNSTEKTSEEIYREKVQASTIWTVKSKEYIREVKASENTVVFATDTKVYIQEGEASEPFLIMENENLRGSYIAVSEIEDQLFLGVNINKNCEVYQIENQKPVQVWKQEGDEATIMAFVPGKKQISFTTDDQIELWDFEQNEQLGSWDVPTDANDLVISPDGKKLAACVGCLFADDDEPGVYLIHLDNNESIIIEEPCFKFEDIGAEYLAFSPDSSRLAASDYHAFWILNTEDGKVTQELSNSCKLDGHYPTGLAWFGENVYRGVTSDIEWFSGSDNPDLEELRKEYSPSRDYDNAGFLHDFDSKVIKNFCFSDQGRRFIAALSDGVYCFDRKNLFDMEIHRSYTTKSYSI